LSKHAAVRSRSDREHRYRGLADGWLDDYIYVEQPVNKVQDHGQVIGVSVESTDTVVVQLAGGPVEPRRTLGCTEGRATFRAVIALLCLTVNLDIFSRLLASCMTFDIRAECTLRIHGFTPWFGSQEYCVHESLFGKSGKHLSVVSLFNPPLTLFCCPTSYLDNRSFSNSTLFSVFVHRPICLRLQTIFALLWANPVCC